MRKKRGLSQQEVADKLDRNANTIAKYERNILTPSVEVLVQLAILYNSSVDYILGLSSRTPIYLDGFSEEQQRFIVNVAQQARDILADNKTGD